MSQTKAQLVGGVGISTAESLVVGSATTFTEDLVVQGDARVTGILTVGTSSITLDGSNNEIKVGSAVTISSSTGLSGSGANLTSLNASNLSTGTLPDARFPATLPTASGANLTSLNASNLASGTVATARLATGTANSSSFLRGDQTWAGVDPFTAGTVMLFQQTAAPTGWTKITTHNNKALRVVSGTAGSGGSTAFTSVFTSRSVTGTVGDTTLTTSQIPSHTHDTRVGSNNFGSIAHIQAPYGTAGTEATAPFRSVNSNTGSGNSHNHSFSGTALDFAVQYVDVIFASKN